MHRSSSPRARALVRTVATLALALAWTGAGAGAAAAQVLYVPIPSTSALGQAPQVRLSFANPSSADRHFGTLFIPAGEDGTALSGTPLQTAVRAGATVVVDGAALISGAGLLQISGAPQVFASAELTLTLPAGTSDFFLPVLSSADVVAANNVALVEGLRHSDSGSFSNLELVNFSKKLSQCSVSLVASDGSQTVAPATVTVPPMSMRSFGDVLSGAADRNAADVAAQVTCDQSFYPYATVYTANPSLLRFVGASPALAAGIGGSSGSGGGPPPPHGPAGQPVTVSRSGVFFAPVGGNSVLDVGVPLTLNASYNVATIEFDMLVGPFTPHYTAILAMVRSGTRATHTLYFGFDIRGNVGKTFIDLGVPVLEPAIKAGFPWTVGIQYHIKITYDVVQKLLTLQVFSGGTQVDQVQGANFNWDLSDNGQGMKLAFGLPGVADGAYFPPLGWLFSNLSANFR